MSKQTLRVKNLYPNGATKFCFLIGNEIKNSLSPSLHTSWFKTLRLNSVYLPCQIQDENTFKNTITLLLNIDNFLGANITMPFKNSVLQIPNIKHSDSVISTGSSNILYKNQNDNWCLENTDLLGIKKTIESLIPKNIKYNLLILGGGGAASTCIYHGELAPNCNHIFCFTRNPSKSYEKFPLLKQNKKLKIFELDLKKMSEIIKLSFSENSYQIVVNTIPSKNPKDDFSIYLLKSLSAKRTYYFDMLYKNTGGLTFANDHKIKYSNGLLMLEEQAKESFYLWTGIRPK